MSIDDTHRVREERLKKLDALRAEGAQPFSNRFTPSATCAAVLARAAAAPPPGMDAIAEDAHVFAVAGRLMAKNEMGKACFLRLRDRTLAIGESGPQHLQIYAKRDVLSAAEWDALKRHIDVGDIVGIRGKLFVTRTGEPTLFATGLELVTKSVRPLPEKWHGLSDIETRFRQRYVDLIVNPNVRAIFQTRARIIEHIRRFLLARDFMEVETPMMQVIPGGATARPFKTHHNALDIPLYLRIAPELYLKRLVVGGFERVFEINRNFRNEGLSRKHNPEFTMLEFYQAYATYEDLMTLTEDLLSGIAAMLAEHEDGAGAPGAVGALVRPMGEHAINWQKPFARYTVRESLVAIGGLDPDTVASPERLKEVLDARGIHCPSTIYGDILVSAFEGLVEKQLIQPTFITQYPIENSPLARRNEADPAYTDRFELFVAASELANAFSELNDPEDQRRRFEEQVSRKAAGDDEAMFMDADYIRALEYGMPPAAGEGIGIDRLVMAMANQQSIREVILFPHMRPE
jgi:lysyl-tRNA synthetase class 2